MRALGDARLLSILVLSSIALWWILMDRLPPAAPVRALTQSTDIRTDVEPWGGASDHRSHSRPSVDGVTSAVSRSKRTVCDDALVIRTVFPNGDPAPGIAVSAQAPLSDAPQDQSAGRGPAPVLDLSAQFTDLFSESWSEDLGVSDADGNLRVSRTDRLPKQKGIRLVPRLLSGTDASMVVGPEDWGRDPIRLVVPRLGFVEVRVVGPDGRPWDWPGSSGKLSHEAPPDSAAWWQDAPCNEKGRVRFRVGADRQRYRFSFDPFALPGYRGVRLKSLSIHAPAAAGATTRFTYRIPRDVRILEGRIEGVRSILGRRFEFHAVTKGGEEIAIAHLTAEDGSFRTLVESTVLGVDYILIGPRLDEPLIAFPERPVDEPNRLNLGTLTPESLPLVRRGQIRPVGMRPPSGSTTWDTVSRPKLSILHGQRRSASPISTARVVVRQHGHFEIRGVLPKQGDLFLNLRSPALATLETLELDRSTSDIEWVLQLAASVRVVVDGVPKLGWNQKLVLVREGDEAEIDGFRGTDERTGFAMTRFHGIRSGAYRVRTLPEGSRPSVDQRVVVRTGTEQTIAVAREQ